MERKYVAGFVVTVEKTYGHPHADWESKVDVLPGHSFWGQDEQEATRKAIGHALRTIADQLCRENYPIPEPGMGYSWGLGCEEVPHVGEKTKG